MQGSWFRLSKCMMMIPARHMWRFPLPLVLPFLPVVANMKESRAATAVINSKC
uniref:Uncharacterized protein n=1 Tax=Arundo donax TaxID=35708 RepID=A0A0A9HDB6_ARUDO